VRHYCSKNTSRNFEKNKKISDIPRFIAWELIPFEALTE